MCAARLTLAAAGNRLRVGVVNVIGVTALVVINDLPGRLVPDFDAEDDNVFPAIIAGRLMGTCYSQACVES